MSGDIFGGSPNPGIPLLGELQGQINGAIQNRSRYRDQARLLNVAHNQRLIEAAYGHQLAHHSMMAQHAHETNTLNTTLAQQSNEAKASRRHERVSKRMDMAHEVATKGTFEQRSEHNERMLPVLQSAMVTKPEHGETYMTGATYHPENGISVTGSSPHMAKSEDQIRRSERSVQAAKSRKNKQAP